MKSDFGALRARLDAVRAAIEAAGVDAWVLYDLHARNPVAAGLLGLGDLTRRYFVVVPARGEPVAVIHGIEEAPFDAWPWHRERYVGWRELDAALRRALGGARRVAMETSARGAVPGIDFVPGGIVELVRSAGPDVVSSGDLVSRFYASWSEAQLASHRRAARVLAEVARGAFDRLAARVRAGDAPTEGALAEWVLDQLATRGCGVGRDCIVARGPNAADPHYDTNGGGEAFRRGDVVLLDLWAKEAEDTVYADQTWMAVLGPRLPESAQPLWDAIRDGRDAGVALLRERARAGEPVQGYEVDDAVRGVIEARGYGDAFIHRTGHSIDRATHGAGPNIDNLETHETRRLIPGVGFSIEPGVYVPGLVGLRTEINVFMGPDGPEVTTPEPQAQPFALLEEA